MVLGTSRPTQVGRSCLLKASQMTLLTRKTWSCPLTVLLCTNAVMTRSLTNINLEEAWEGNDGVVFFSSSTKETRQLPKKNLARTRQALSHVAQGHISRSPKGDMRMPSKAIAKISNCSILEVMLGIPVAVLTRCARAANLEHIVLPYHLAC